MKKFLKGKGWILSIICVAILSGIVFLTINFQENHDRSLNTNVFAKLKQEVATENTVPIAMAADNNYTYPTIVSITSLMTTSKSTTHYDIYIMTPGGFAEENKQKLLSLQEKFENRCRINLIDMQDRYKNANDKGHITTPTYYRLSLPSLLPDLNKAIWIDGDTLIFEDLTEMLNIDMENFYYKGFLDCNVDGLEEFGIEDDHYICAGVLLINLEKLRQDEMEYKFEKFIAENNDRLRQHDQTVINAMCNKNTGVLPAKYGIFNFSDVERAKTHSKILKAKNRYTEKEMQTAFEHPAILHYVNKPWGENEVNRKNLWWEFAAKTDYFDEIKAHYGVA